MTKENIKILNLPAFPGFYESIYSSNIDYGLDSEVENYVEYTQVEKYGKQVLDKDIVWEVMYDNVNYHEAHLAYCREHVEQFNNAVKEETNVELGLKFESMSSPREYNFTTDRVFVEVDAEVMRGLYEEVK